MIPPNNVPGIVCVRMLMPVLLVALAGKEACPTHKTKDYRPKAKFESIRRVTHGAHRTHMMTHGIHQYSVVGNY